MNTAGMKKCVLLLTYVVACCIAVVAQAPATPDKIYGDLFRDVQVNKVFPDGKTFVDCVPRRSPQAIVADYNQQKGPKFDLKKFVEDNFERPRIPQLNYITREKDVVVHIKNLWGTLRRDPDTISLYSTRGPFS
jgi:alpha,alpha-trehalase